MCTETYSKCAQCLVPLCPRKCFDQWHVYGGDNLDDKITFAFNLNENCCILETAQVKPPDCQVLPKNKKPRSNSYCQGGSDHRNYSTTGGCGGGVIPSGNFAAASVTCMPRVIVPEMPLLIPATPLPDVTLIDERRTDVPSLKRRRSLPASHVPGLTVSPGSTITERNETNSSLQSRTDSTAQNPRITNDLQRNTANLASLSFGEVLVEKRNETAPSAPKSTPHNVYSFSDQMVIVKRFGINKERSTFVSLLLYAKNFRFSRFNSTSWYNCN